MTRHKLSNRASDAGILGVGLALRPAIAPTAWLADGCPCIAGVRCIAGMERCGICVSRQQRKVPTSG
jgi:hypothetical protein